MSTSRNADSAQTVHSAILSALDLISSESGLQVGEEAEILLEKYLKLVREWNEFASLVSVEDCQSMLEAHAADSLGLVPLVNSLSQRGFVLDIGSGGGFPIIPVKIALPSVPVFLMERSGRKIGFLRKVVGALGLSGISIVHSSFPQGIPEDPPTVITARAVEKPARVLKDIGAYITPGTAFLCQTPDPGRFLPEDLELAPVTDSFQERGLRRGDLTIVRRGEATG